MAQETEVVLSGKVTVSWVGYVGDRVGKSDMAIIGEIFLV